MSRVFISNIKSQEKKNDIVLDPTIGIQQLHEKTIDLTGNTVYVIDVHSTFKEAEKMQQQGGVIIYRYLLKHFEKSQDKLKVVFYSPIPKEDLVKLKPENYILKLLPFIECKYEDGQFDKELETIISANNFPQFNNASENLLSGWALANNIHLKQGKEAEKIDNIVKKILFIDDQQDEWKITFNSIFKDGDCVEYLDTAVVNDFSSNFKESVSHISKKLASSENSFGCILSDFYLTENHEVTHWKDKSRLLEISGFKLFNALRKDFPNIPYVFHTSSNKANIYKFFDARGVDDWLVKDTTVCSLHKESYYHNFVEVINEIMVNDIYSSLLECWEKLNEVIKKIKDTFNGKSRIAESLLKESWMCLRRSANRELLYEEAILENTENIAIDNVLACSIINSMYKVIEVLWPKVSIKQNNGNTKYKPNSNFPLGLYTDFIRKIRNLASHSEDKNAEYITILDAVFTFNLTLDFLYFLDDNNKDTIKKDVWLRISPRDFKNNAPQTPFKYSLYYLYLEVYFKQTNTLFETQDSYVLKRIKELYEILSKDTTANNEIKEKITSKYMTDNSWNINDEIKNFIIR